MRPYFLIGVFVFLATAGCHKSNNKDNIVIDPYWPSPGAWKWVESDLAPGPVDRVFKPDTMTILYLGEDLRYQIRGIGLPGHTGKYQIDTTQSIITGGILVDTSYIFDTTLRLNANVVMPARLRARVSNDTLVLTPTIMLPSGLDRHIFVRYQN